MHKLIVVDDDEYIRDLYEEILKDADFNVDTAVDGKDGYDKIIEGDYDLVLLDIMMPKMDGVEVLRELSENAKAKASKVVLLTNLAHDPVMKEALGLGAKAYLIKADMTPDQLVEKVKEYLKD
ncbi:MAG: Transcriptional regulatory protein SrrA [Microgenomates bacterium OLB23]|nr:MAG: Transcriptional regulatory protein SrrA [Microgenomates bacterium OLB23]